MMPSVKSRTLFGGALRSAGFAAVATVTSPVCADFVPESSAIADNYTFNYALIAEGTSVVNEFDAASGAAFPLPTITIDQNGMLSSYAGPLAMGASVSTSSGSTWHVAGAVVRQYFTVDVAKGATVYWDFLEGSVYAQTYLVELGVGTIFHHMTGTSGSQSLELEAGAHYLFLARAATEGSGPLSASASLVWKVPAPGALALFGISMIGMRRRRRAM